MRKLLYLTICPFLFSCNHTETKPHSVDKTKESKFKNLLTKYKDISFDTLKIFSAEDLESRAYKFKGTKLDSADILLFPEAIGEQYLNNDGYFACYKFFIDSNKIGLITRTPSTYEPTSIKLLVFDNQRDTIIDLIELAETFGDAGDVSEKISWVFKDKNQSYKSLVWVEESHDNSAEDEKDTTIERWNNYYLVDLSKPKIDTLSQDEKILLMKFGHLVKQQASR